MGRAADGRASHRHVRLCAVGPAGAHACAWCATVSASSRSITDGRMRRFVFASELKAFEALPGWRPELDQRRARRLSAARLCAVAAFDLSRHRQARAWAYRHHRCRRQRRDARFLESSSRPPSADSARRFELGDREATDALEMLLADAVSGGLSPMCRSARFSQAASILRPSRR